MANNDIRQFLAGARNMKNMKNNLNESEEITSTATPEETAEEKKAFNQAVGMASFGNFQKYKDNVVFQGSIGSGETLKWQLSIVDGLTISTQQFSLSEDNFITLEKLKAYFDIWKNKWMSALNGGTSSIATSGAPVDTSAASQGGSGGGMGGMGMGGGMGI
jgi:hypothetical protein